MLDFLRGLPFFKGREAAGLVEDDLDFDRWIKVHLDWRSRLNAYISGESDEKLDENVVCLDDRCELGRWIYSHGRYYYGDLPVFNQLRYYHADFHASAGRVVSLFKLAGAGAAKKALNEDFDLNSLRVIHGLQHLERHVKA